MQKNTLAREIEIVARLRNIDEKEVVRRIVEFIDVEFHGIVPMDLGVPESPPEAGTRTTNEVK